MPPDTQEGLTKFFLPLSGSKMFLRSTSPKRKNPREQNLWGKYEHVVKLFIDLNYGVSKKQWSELRGVQKTVWLFDFMSVENDFIYTICFYIFQIVLFHLNCGINKSKIG